MSRAACAVLAPVLLLFPCHVGAKDLGMFYGEPTPLLAMYVAQVNFAVERCSAAGLVDDTKGTARLLKHFNNGIQLRKYRREDEVFAANLEHFLGNYRAAWEGAGEERHRRFCEGLAADLKAKKESFFGWAAAIEYYRNEFSPLTAEAAARKQKWAGIALVAGSVATSAASISAGNDAVSSAKAGDWATSNQQMAASRSFNQAGAAMFSSQGTADAGHGRPASSCPVVAHFSSYPAPVEHEVWITYQSVLAKCSTP